LLVRAKWLRRVLVAVTVAASLCLVGSATALAAGNPIVVIVPGLQMNAPGMTPTSGGCGAQGGLSSLCQAYVNQGYDVYIPPTSTTGGNGIVINTGGDVATNASSLASYVSNIESQNNGANVSAVGYSMGGLMVVDAVRDNGMAVNSIVTIGSPLDGSYMADDLTAAANMSCGLSLGCMAIAAGAQATINNIGQGAIYSLTSDDRAAENSGQGPVGVPMTTIGGNGCGTTLGDCVVGLSSQFGTNSNLGPTSQTTDPDVHTAGPYGILTKACNGCSPELDDPNVAKAAVQASQSGCSSSSYCIPAPQARRALAMAQARRLTIRHSSKAPTHATLTLNTVSTITIAAGASQTVTGANLIASTSPIATGCAGTTPAAPSASTSIYYTSASDLACATNQVTVENQGSQPITVAVLSNPVNAQATVGAQGTSRVPVTVTAAAGITTVKIVNASGKALYTVNGAGRHTVSFTVPRTVASQHILSVTVAGQSAPFTAPIPTLQAALVKGTLTVRPRSVAGGQTVTITGSDWATGTVNLTLVANGSSHYVLTTLTAKATARKGFTISWTAPSGLTARTPVKVIAAESQRKPATASFVVTAKKQH
jgi:hypothetical protein